jgi:hypothetical protein
MGWFKKEEGPDAGPLKARLRRLRDGVGQVLDDFTSLEVNTIVKPGMTAQKMPTIAHALHDIASDYEAYLSEDCGLNLFVFFEVDLDRTADKVALRAALGAVRPGPLDPAWDNDGLTNEWRTFWRLRYAAKHAQRLPVAGPGASARVMKLARIKSTCDQLFGLLDQVEGSRDDAACHAMGLRCTRQHLLTDAQRGNEAHAGDADAFDAKQRAIIRKAWELGLEEIKMQTIVQLDGDVITRMTPDVAQAGGALPSIHQKGVDAAIGIWRLLVDVIEGIARIVVK